MGHASQLQRNERRRNRPRQGRAPRQRAKVTPFARERRSDVLQNRLDDFGQWIRGHSSAGRASRLQREGRRFDPDWLHQHTNCYLSRRVMSHAHFLCMTHGMRRVLGRAV
jgi:hypothetical protein